MPPKYTATHASRPLSDSRPLRHGTLESSRQWPGPSNISMFLTNLRLLGLEEFPDWPHITNAVFSTKDANQNQKNRLRCVEWSLYRLFELWDIDTTNNKLRPFFPPLEPLQSLNLRAALFRCLSDLKKDGALGRETILRKTMLDECKGEKFEEVILVFSNVVLRKVINEGDGWSNSVAERLATAPVLGENAKRTLVPLIIAHRGSLADVLAQREILRGRYEDFSQLLDLKQRKVRRKHEQIKADAQEQYVEADLDQVTARRVKKLLEDSWMGDSRWVEVILQGESKQGQDGLFSTPFARVWQSVHNGTIRDIEDGTSRGLLEGLSERVEEQQSKLKYWRKIHDEIMKDSEGSKIDDPMGQPKSASGLELDFSQHIDLLPSKMPPSDAQSSVNQELPEGSEYYSIIASMRQELLNGGEEKPNIREKEDTMLSNHNPTSPAPLESSFTAPPSTVKADGDVLSWVNQTGLPREKYERERRDSIHSPTISRPETIRNDSFDSQRTQFSGRANISRPREPSKSSEKSESPLPDRPKRMKHERLSLFDAEEQELLADEMVTSIKNAEPSPVKQKPTTLAERTRLSMANLGSLGTLPSPAMLPPPSRSRSNTARRESNIEDLSGHTLLERTRQSMSMLPDPSRHRKSIHQPRESFPINQWETPQKPSYEEEPESNLKEELLEETIDYASVFKSRPKIALSPVISPANDPMLPNLASVLHDDSEDDSFMDSSFGYGSSPLAAASKRAARH
ncbi:MAG: hypothetical protein M1834_000056 [Cirrosporium novae-zelandiae]|nr:MAG: hypothetical protein M1834_000056 [Cirrosporium novae-zelandiae]